MLEPADISQWDDCKTKLATKLMTKCYPGSVGQEGTNNIFYSGALEVRDSHKDTVIVGHARKDSVKIFYALKPQLKAPKAH